MAAATTRSAPRGVAADAAPAVKATAAVSGPRATRTSGSALAHAQDSTLSASLQAAASRLRRRPTVAALDTLTTRAPSFVAARVSRGPRLAATACDRSGCIPSPLQAPQRRLHPLHCRCTKSSTAATSRRMALSPSGVRSRAMAGSRTATGKASTFRGSQMLSAPCTANATRVLECTLTVRTTAAPLTLAASLAARPCLLSPAAAMTARAARPAADHP